MTDALDMLRTRLGPFGSGLRSPQSISEPAEMTRAKKRVEREHGGAGFVADSRSIMSSIESFRITGKVDGYRELKYVCLGMAAVDAGGWCAIGDTKLRKRVAKLVEAQTESRRRVRCFQALLSSYWSFPLNGKRTSNEAKAGWRHLRSWLRTEREQLLQSEEIKPPWFASLTKYAALLGDQPCDDFGAALLRGDSGELRDAMEQLAIPTDSWVPEEAIIGHMRAACALDDEGFRAKLAELIHIGTGQGTVQLADALRVRSVAMLVSRYAMCSERAEHMALRDAAVSIIGNPWLRRANWDASVLDAKGKPDNQSREMVNGWLKRRLITDFFELLSIDGTGDTSRVEYWLRFEPVIEDMWFALGSAAQYRRGESFNDFRSRANGRLLDLAGTTSDNNAFVMKVGRYLLVEFGAKGNAMYAFEWRLLSKPLINTLTSGLAKTDVHIDRLKDKVNMLSKHNHIDSSSRTWQQKFDDVLVPLIGHQPALPPRGGRADIRALPSSLSPATWNYFVRTNNLRVQDNRSKAGAIWIHGAKQPSVVVTQLKAWGFKLRDPIGWFKE